MKSIHFRLNCLSFVQITAFKRPCYPKVGLWFWLFHGEGLALDERYFCANFTLQNTISTIGLAFRHFEREEHNFLAIPNICVTRTLGLSKIFWMIIFIIYFDAMVDEFKGLQLAVMTIYIVAMICSWVVLIYWNFKCSVDLSGRPFCVLTSCWIKNSCSS